jgi:hypothetical protein
MDKASCPDHTPTHNIVMSEASPSRPTASREHQSVQQTLSKRHHTLSKVIASIFLELIFRTGIHASNLIDLPSTPPRRQTVPSTCARSSGHVHRWDPATPCHRDSPSWTPPMNHRSTLFLPDLALAPRMMLPGGRMTLKVPTSSDLGGPDLGIPSEQPERWRDDGCKVDASKKVTAKRHRHRPLSLTWEHGFHQMPRLPTLAAWLDLHQYVQFGSTLASQPRCQWPKAGFPDPRPISTALQNSHRWEGRSLLAAA